VTDEHLSRATLGGYTSRTLSIADLERVDRHLTNCPSCRDALLQLTPDGSSLLNVIQFEQRRHLSYKQLEAMLEQRTPDPLDDLAHLHLSECEGCQRELADLQAFDVTLSKTAPARQTAAARRPSMWRMLFWPATGLAGAIAVAVLVLVNTGIIPLGARAVQIVVTLTSPDPENGRRVESLTGGQAGPRLPPDIARRLQEAIRAAAATSEPQTIQFTMSAAEYEMLSKVTSALGDVQSDSTASRLAGRQRIEVSLTIRPSMSRR